MPIVPRKPDQKILYCEAHVPVWLANAVGLGLLPAEVSALQTLTTSARADQLAQATAEEARRTATNKYQSSTRTMARAAADLILKIKGKAATAPDPDAIYNLAQIPPPATPSPVGPPGTPTNFKVTLNPDGTLELKWKCANPTGSGGTIYQVSRKVGTGAFAIVGGSGLRKFNDTTVPAGVASVTYRIQAIRSTVSGAANDFVVNFGVGGGGEMTASVAQGPNAAGAPKLAA